MENLSSFFEMGGYAAYVWPAYGLAAVVMVAVLAASLRSAKTAERDLEAAQRLRPNRQRRRDKAPVAATEVPET